METQLDRDLSRVMDGLSAPGGMFATVPFRKFGHDLPMIAAAPPSLPGLFAYFADLYATRPFIVDGAQRFTFAEIHAAARVLAGGLVEGHGLQKGERVGIAARNSASWIVAYMAVVMAGGCVALLNGWWQGEELAQGIDMVGCRLVLADDARAERLSGHPHGARVLPIRHDCPPLEGLAALLDNGGSAATPLPDVGAEDHATLVFTSGSTGTAKGALSDHRGVVQAAFNYAAQTVDVLSVMAERGVAPPADAQPVALVNLPLFHVTGEVPVFLQSFVIGRKLVLMPRWDAVEAMELIAREKVTYFVGVPLMSFEIATHPDRDKHDLSSCVTFASGGAPRPVDHVTRIRDALPHAFPIIGYGLTETNAVGAGNFNENYLAKPGSTGRASRPLVDLAILDDDGAPLPRGEVGEIAIRSVCNFLCYWNNPQDTAAAITPDGYFRSGDLGHLDEDGYVFIVDRKKDIIIRGGENISCIEVEGAIYAHPCIAEASVFGLPHPHYGEVPVAVYHTKPGCGVSPQELTSFLGQHIAQFKIPVHFWPVENPLPRLGTEKVDKRAIRQKYAAQWQETCNA